MTKKEKLEQIIKKGSIKMTELKELNLTVEQAKEYELDIIDNDPNDLESAIGIIRMQEEKIAELNKENQTRRETNTKLEEEISSLKENLETINTKFKELESSKFSKDETTKQLQTKLSDLEKELEQKLNIANNFENKLKTYEEREQTRRKSLLEKLPEEKRGIYADTKIEVLEDVIAQNKPQDSPNTGKQVVEDVTPKPNFVQY